MKHLLACLIALFALAAILTFGLGLNSFAQDGGEAEAETADTEMVEATDDTSSMEEDSTAMPVEEAAVEEEPVATDEPAAEEDKPEDSE